MNPKRNNTIDLLVTLYSDTVKGVFFFKVDLIEKGMQTPIIHMNLKSNSMYYNVFTYYTWFNMTPNADKYYKYVRTRETLRPQAANHSTLHAQKTNNHQPHHLQIS